MRNLRVPLTIAVLTSAWLTSARAQGRPPIYGYGSTLDQAAMQCRAQGGLSSTDTTRAVDGSIQMRCQRRPASTCSEPNVDTLRADRAAASGSQRPIYEFVQPEMNRVDPEVTVLWGQTRNEPPDGGTGLRTDVYVCDGGAWKWTHSFGIIRPRTSADTTQARRVAEQAEPDSSRPPFYGFGPTMEAAAAQCRVQSGAPTTDTTRVEGHTNEIQMRCKRTGITPQGRMVRPLPQTMDAQAIRRQCQVVSRFTTTAGGDIATRGDFLLSDVRNHAAAAGANAVKVDSTTGNAASQTAFARAFRCTGLPD